MKKALLLGAAIAVLPAPSLAQQHPPELLPDVKGVVSWRTLAQVEPVRVGERFVPKYAKQVSALDGTEVRLQGFMYPLEVGPQQRRFVLMAMSPSCPYCMSGGPETMVEVLATRPVKFSVNPVTVVGRFTVVRDASSGPYYRLLEATSAAD